jgi:DNA-binding response OmpR family regulator
MKGRILIIDDNNDILKTLRDVLKEKGYGGELARTCKEAIIKARKWFF